MSQLEDLGRLTAQSLGCELKADAIASLYTLEEGLLVDPWGGGQAGRIALHEGLLCTLWQHPRVQPKTKPQSMALEASPDAPSTHVRRLEAFDAIENILKARPQKKTGLVSLAGWVVPGATPRHQGEVGWEGSPAQALALAVAPLGALYARMGNGFDWALIVPHALGLSPEAFEAARRAWARLGYPVFSGLDEALAHASAHFEVPCEGHLYAQVAWNKQRVRTKSKRMYPPSPWQRELLVAVNRPPKWSEAGMPMIDASRLAVVEAILAKDPLAPARAKLYLAKPWEEQICGAALRAAL